MLMLNFFDRATAWKKVSIPFGSFSCLSLKVDMVILKEELRTLIFSREYLWWRVLFNYNHCRHINCDGPVAKEYNIIICIFAISLHTHPIQG